MHRLVDLSRLQTELKRQLAPLKCFQAHTGIDVFLQDGLRILRRDLLNLHATRRRRHEHGLPFPTINQNADIKLLLNRQRFFNQQPLHNFPFRPGLVRHQLHAQHLAGKLSRFFHRLGNLHATALAAAAGMNLRFHHNSGRAGIEQVHGCSFGLLARGRHLTARHRDTIFFQDPLGLILMNFHNDS